VTAAVYTQYASTGTDEVLVSIVVQTPEPTHDVPVSSLGDIPFTFIDALSLDGAPPIVSSIVRAGTNPTNAANVDWTVTFSEDVTCVGTADFSLTTFDLGGTPVVTAVTPVNGAVYTVTASTGTCTGTVRLDVPNTAPAND